MKYLALLLLFYPLLSHAGVIGSVLDREGKIDQAKLALYVEQVEPYIRQYPPRFKNESHMNEIIASTENVAAEIVNHDHPSIQNQEILTHAGFVLAMAHNLDFNTAEKAKEFFEASLAVDRNNVEANYLFGMFLISTRAYHFQSEPYLQKALELGERDAMFSLGLLAIRKGEKQQGLQLLNTYSKENPENEHVKNLIKGVEDGTLKFHESGG